MQCTDFCEAVKNEKKNQLKNFDNILDFAPNIVREYRFELP